MSESGGNSNEARLTSFGEPTELQLTADRVASGLNLLRWALIASLASGIVKFVGSILISGVWPLNYASRAWVLLVLGTVGWIVAPLALLGVLRILRVRSWPVRRWLVISLVVYFAADSIWTPAASAHRTFYLLNPLHSVRPVLDAVSTVIALLMSLLHFAMLFAAFHLAGAVDACFDQSLISARHRRWLLWAGLALHGLMLAWWAVWMIWDPLTRLENMGYDDVTSGMIIATIPVLLVSLPYTAWLIWLLVVALRIARKLKRFAKRNRCPRCDYYLHDAVERGCPECGWMRASEPAAGGEAV
jgi:hypothetical protein